MVDFFKNFYNFGRLEDICHFSFYLTMSKRYRAFCFTDFEPSEARKAFWLEQDFKYLVFQLEKCPESGREHYQGYVELKKQSRLKALKKWLGEKVHFEARKGTAQEAADYCKKEESRIDGYWESGTISKPGKRSDLDAVKRAIDEGATEVEVADQFFGTWCRNYRAFARYKRLKTESKEDCLKEVSCFWGDAGTGKTRAVYEKEGYEIYSKPDGPWFDGYEGQDVVLFDDYTGDLPSGQFLKLLDRYPMKVPVKGDFVNWTPKRIYLTSNLSPEEWYPNASAATHAAIRRRIGCIKRYRSGLVTEPAAVEGFIAPSTSRHGN